MNRFHTHSSRLGGGKLDRGRCNPRLESVGFRGMLMRRVTFVGVTLVLLALAGCSPFAVVAHIFTAGSAIKAIYHLPENATVLVLVDDPQNLLHNRRLTRIAETQAVFLLKQNKAAAKMIPVDSLSALADKLGSQYPTTPITTLGQKLGADIVVYAIVSQITLQYAQNVYHPSAQVRVKVIDVAHHQRLFPNPGPITADADQTPGYALTVRLPHQTVDLSQQEVNNLATRHLAEQIGVDLAQLFYDHAETTVEKTSLGNEN